MISRCGLYLKAGCNIRLQILGTFVTRPSIILNKICLMFRFNYKTIENRGRKLKICDRYCLTYKPNGPL